MLTDEKIKNGVNKAVNSLAKKYNLNELEDSEEFEYLDEVEPSSVTFSDKYQPLFELLNSRNDLADLKAYIRAIGTDNVTEQMNVRLEYLKTLTEVDTVLISGGRDSGKSFAIGCFNVVASNEFNHRILFTRQTMSSTDNSITQALDNRMSLIGVADDYTFANNNYLCKHNDGKISITGQKTSVGTQTAKLKSLEDYSIFETDEGEELTDFESWNKVKRSVRATDVQCLSIIVFNPPSKKHWMYEEFYASIPAGFNGIVGRTMYIHTTYIDNGKENMAEHNWHEYERLRLQYEKYEAIPKTERDLVSRSSRLFKDWREYKTTILGGFKEVAEGVIFDYTIGDYVPNHYENTYGADQGFTHPSAVIKVNVDRNQKKIWLKEIYYQTGATETQIYNAIKSEVGNSRIWIDDAAAMFIAGLKERGLVGAKGAKKPKIKDRINAALDYEIIIDPSSTNLINEMDEYRWSNNKTKEAPVDANNHACDAWGYAFYRMINTLIAEPGSH